MSNRFWGNGWIGLVLRLIPAGVLLIAGTVKLLDPSGSRSAILAYRVFPVEWASALGVALPVLEIVVGVMLLLGFATRWAALLAGLLMVGFIAGVTSVWLRGYSIDCGCFGGGGDVGEDGKVWRYASEILRDLGLLLACAWLVVWPRTRGSVDAAVHHYSGTTTSEIDVQERQGARIDG
jgi:uncharacterized membrane protein YphA (DoxX/SURF4 family)